MAKKYLHPGVYINEISSLSPSVTPIETAIPAFIGYTEKDSCQGTALVNKPKRISSLAEYSQIFGSAPHTRFSNSNNPNEGIAIKKDATGKFVLDRPINDPFDNLQLRMYYCMQMYFYNGGGTCYVVSCGKYENAVFTNAIAMEKALDALRNVSEPTILVFPDAPSLSEHDFYNLYSRALAQAASLKDRIVIADVYLNLSNPLSMSDFKAGRMDMNYPVGSSKLAERFRTGIGNNHLPYGVVYFPWLQTSLSWHTDESLIPVVCHDAPLDTVKVLRKYPAPGQTHVENPQESLYHSYYPLYQIIKSEMDHYRVILPPSSSLAGIYAMVDNSRGVWKAPANVSVSSVIKLMANITEQSQQEMNISSSGKSINAIRQFPGIGNLVWGARTLAGNDPEWKYINIRRYYIMARESIEKATDSFVFEPNDANTWVRVKSMIENFFTSQWKSGALAGALPSDAFYVRIGLGETMTPDDLKDGRMIIEIGMALARPAEFILLRIVKNMGKA
jgi:phage tail sheath protein FI